MPRSLRPSDLCFGLCFPGADIAELLGLRDGLPRSRYRCSESALPADELDDELDLELAELERDLEESEYLLRLLDRDLLELDRLLADLRRGLT